jgi:tyrosine-specific transport protein
MQKVAFGASATVLLGLSLEVDNVCALMPTSGHGALSKKIRPLRVYTNSPEDPSKEVVVAPTMIAQLQEKMGKVEDERIIFPEYDSGEVSRMFSALEYSKSEQDGGVRAEHSTGSVAGAAALVAGTMVGAGILALPTATASVGFLPSTAAMGVAWVYMTMSGLLIAELSINRLGQSGKPVEGLLELYEGSGPKWSKVGSVAYFFLHYTLLVAYITQGGVNLDGFLGTAGLSQLSEVAGIGQVLFASACGLSLYSASPALIEKANNTFVFVLAGCLVGIIGIGAGSADFSSLVDLSNQHPEQVPNAFPIIFLSLGFQSVVPTVVKRLEGDRGKITKAIIAGTSIPTLMFVAWNAVVLGNTLGADLTNVDPVALLRSAEGGNSVFGNLIGAFSTLALVTSLISFVYGLLDAWADVFSLPRDGPDFEKWKAPLFGLVFVPPLALSLANPDIFYKALDFGGAFGISTLFLVLPPFMVWAQRYGDEQQPLITKPMVPFGKISLGSMWKAAGTLILEQGAEKLGVFEFVQEHFLSQELP